MKENGNIKFVLDQKGRVEMNNNDTKWKLK